MGRRLVVFEVMAFLILIFSFAPKPIAAQTQVSDSLTLTVYLDGFVQVDQIVEFNQPVLSFNVTLLSNTFQNLVIVDENNLPLENTINGDIASIYNVGSTKIVVSYLTQDLTTKTGPYWTITTDYQESIVLVLPRNASIISINAVPELIESFDGSLKLTMPTGLTEVIYTTEHAFDEQNKTTSSTSSLDQLLLTAAVVLVLIIPLALTGILLHKRKKTPKPKTKKDEKQEEVDLEKLFSKHRELRQDETQVIQYLASKHGKAFEAELFELINLPRTTTWRLIRRLEGLEIVYIKKSRRQNIVLIRDKYLKKQ